jgi:hypothetical protein
MSHQLLDPHDPVTDPVALPDGLVPDAVPPDNTPADTSVDQPIDQPNVAQPSDPALPEAPGTPAANRNSSSDPASPSSDARSSTPPNSKQPRAPRPKDPARAKKLLKTDRSGVGGPATTEGKSVSCLNNLKHGMYSRLDFYLLPDESQQDYDDMLHRMRTQYQPVDEPSETTLEMLVQAFFRLRRCNFAEFLAESADRTDIVKFLRGVAAAGMHRTRSERSYYLHLEKLKRHLAEFEKHQQAIRDQMNQDGVERINKEPEPEPRFNAEGEEMDPTYPQYSYWKLSCIPEDPCNEVYEFDRTAKGKMSVKRTPLRDFEGGRMLHPSFKPKGMKHDWPDYLLGPYKDYYKNLRKPETEDKPTS